MDRLALAAGWSGQLAWGLLVTFGLAVLSILGGSALGLAGALAGARPGLAGRLVLAGAALLRSLPELLVIFAAYYGFAFLLQALLNPLGFKGFIAIGSFTAAVIALALIHGAFSTEVFRGAFAAVPTGPLDAARALGLRPIHVFCLVEAPIALRYGLPGWMNLAVVSLKLTPLAAAIGLEDLLRTAGDAGRNTRDYLLFYLIALAVYLALAAGIGAAQLHIEARLRRVWAG